MCTLGKGTFGKARDTSSSGGRDRCPGSSRVAQAARLAVGQGDGRAASGAPPSPAPLPPGAWNGCWLLSLSRRLSLFDRLSVSPILPNELCQTPSIGTFKRFSRKDTLSTRVTEEGGRALWKIGQHWALTSRLCPSAPTELPGGHNAHCPRGAPFTSISSFLKKVLMLLLICLYSAQLDGLAYF